VKTCSHCGSISSDDEAKCGVCGNIFDDFGSHPPVELDSQELPPWIDKGPHRTRRCSICRARIPQDRLDEHYSTVHWEWARWLSKRRWFYRIAKASLVILLVLVIFAVVTGSYWIPIVFVFIFLLVFNVFSGLDQSKSKRIKLQWTQESQDTRH
jgi:hypothetical protein